MLESLFASVSKQYGTFRADTLGANLTAPWVQPSDWVNNQSPHKPGVVLSGDRKAEEKLQVALGIRGAHAKELTAVVRGSEITPTKHNHGQ